MRLFLLALVLSVSCAPARHRARGTIVRDVSFQGNGSFFSGQNDYQLAAPMQQRSSRWGLLVWPFTYTVKPQVLDSERLLDDAYRLEVWYAHHGWFDARVEGFELRRVRPETKRRAEVVDIHGIVTPGIQSTVRSIEIEGLPTVLDAIGRAALRQGPVQEGDPFDLTLVEALRQRLLDRLVDHARPYASVELVMAAHPQDQAVDVKLVADPGILGRIGAVSVAGDVDVDERFILGSAEIAPGDPYSLNALRDARRRLFEMGTFSIVRVEPNLSDVTAPLVPVRINVTESKFRTFRLGAGFDYDSFLPVVRAQARLKHVNLFHELVRADVGVNAGVALDISQGADFSGGIPTWGADVSFEYPRLFSQRASVQLVGEIEQQVFNGLWAYRRPAADLHFVWRQRPQVVFRVGPHFENYLFLGDFGPLQQVAQQRLFGIESADAFEYQLTALDQFGTWDWRDDPVRTTRGSYTSVWLREAFRLSEAGYDFFRVNGEHRRYFPLRMLSSRQVFPFTLVGRARGTLVVPFGQTEQIPLPERAFIGGATSIRGFRPNQVGPYTTLCTYDKVPPRSGFLGLGGEEAGPDEERLTRYHLPSGGTVAAELGTELRYDWIYGITLAAFVDGGYLASSLSDWQNGAIRGSAGVGMRYDTLIGPVRFDVSVRPLVAEDQGPVRYTQCRVGDESPRVGDFFSNFPGLRDERRPSLALVLFLTFGEAI